MQKIRTCLASIINKEVKVNSGKKAEDKALAYLKKQKLSLIERNFLCKLGEIDLICLDNGEIVFVEVRYRKNNSHGNAAQSIHQGKKNKVIKAALYWLSINHKQDVAYRFDAILFDQCVAETHLTWLKNAF